MVSIPGDVVVEEGVRLIGDLRLGLVGEGESDKPASRRLEARRMESRTS